MTRGRTRLGLFAVLGLLLAGLTSCLTLDTAELPTVFVGLPASVPLSASGGEGASTWSAVGLPSGLSLNPVTGVIGGSADAAGTYPVSVTVTDDAGSTDTNTYSLVVATGMPADCVTTDCVKLDPDPVTIHVPATAVTAVGRDGAGAATSVSLTAAAPAVRAGDVLVLAPSDLTPSGLIVKATSIAGATGTPRTVTVVASSLTEAFPSGVVKATGDLSKAKVVPPADGGALAATCAGDAKVIVAPTFTRSITPIVDLAWGDRYEVFGHPVGPRKPSLFQFGMEGKLTFKLTGEVSAAVDCSLDVPGLIVPIPLGEAGVALFKLQPAIGLKATGGIRIDTTVALTCDLSYTWLADRPDARSQSCHPTYQPPTVDSAAGADFTVSGGISASLTFNELIGVSGSLSASARLGYHPLQTPQGVLNAKVSANLSACLLCFLGGAAPSVSLWSTTIYDRDLYTWPKPPHTTTTVTSTTTPGGTTTTTTVPTGGTATAPVGANTNVLGISGDGRYLAYNASSAPLGSTDFLPRLYDRVTRSIERPPLDTVDTFAISARISGDGRYVTFVTVRWQGQTSTAEVWMWDRGLEHLTLIATRVENGGQAGFDIATSADGRYTTYLATWAYSGPLAQRPQGRPSQSPSGARGFTTPATESGTSTTAGNPPVAVGDLSQWDRVTGASTEIGTADGFDQSATGRYVVYHDDGGVRQWDRATGAVSGLPIDRADHLEVSGDGRFITYVDLYGSSPHLAQWSRGSGASTTIDRSAGYSWSTSEDGRFVTFGDGGLLAQWDRDAQSSVTIGDAFPWSLTSADGRFVTYEDPTGVLQQWDRVRSTTTWIGSASPWAIHTSEDGGVVIFNGYREGSPYRELRLWDRDA